MNRFVVALAAGGLVLTACGGGEVVVQAQVQNEDGDPRPLTNLQVRALPYDRDAIFDSLGAAYGTPEPEIPAQLSQLQDSISVANETWRDATARWNAGRERLVDMNRRIEGMSRASGEYVVLFREANALHEQVDGYERTMNQAFDRFQSLQDRYSARAEETERAREQWAEAAYADFEVVAEERLRQLRRGEVADTTDENGIVRMTGLAEGEWWIHARYDLPFVELYWNIPVTVGGEPVQIQLSRETAELRPKL